MSPTGWKIVGMVLALAAFAGGGWPSLAYAQRGIEVTVLNLKLTCDPDQCRTAVLEVHERTGVDASSVEYVFAAPPGITLDDPHTTGVEVDGDGAEHYVRPLAAGPGWLKCKWLAKARAGGADGWAKGYCWIGIKK
jgi:hypothetical protein